MSVRLGIWIKTRERLIDQWSRSIIHKRRIDAESPAYVLSPIGAVVRDREAGRNRDDESQSFLSRRGLPHGRAATPLICREIVGLIMRAVNPLLMLPLATLLLASVCFSQKLPRQTADEVLEPISVKTDLYPADADAKKEIDEALKLAARDKKRVLLILGGNWCYDCHVLDRALHEGEAGTVARKNFLLVH